VYFDKQYGFDSLISLGFLAKTIKAQLVGISKDSHKSKIILRMSKRIQFIFINQTQKNIHKFNPPIHEKISSNRLFLKFN